MSEGTTQHRANYVPNELTTHPVTGLIAVTFADSITKIGQMMEILLSLFTSFWQWRLLLRSRERAADDFQNIRKLRMI